MDEQEIEYFLDRIKLFKEWFPNIYEELKPGIDQIEKEFRLRKLLLEPPKQIVIHKWNSVN